ncbi:DEAD/DEAH box helicase family protein [Prevotella sp. LCP21S3_D2]|uniref:DEAD/DEAH box helicase family protein n=1 Tax=Prevotella sp. LCP21S3_D2 TaxID=3438800 RepID=UPI003F9DC6E7
MNVIKLFDYQEDMKERIEKALRLHRSVMAQMPTGTGKTVLLASVVESFLREHSNCNVWIVAHRRELVSQIRETIGRVFSKITPSLFTLKEGNFSKTHPSSLTLKGGSTAFPKPLSPQGTGDVTALRCSEPLRSKVGGPSKVSTDCAGWDRLTATCLRPTEELGDRLGERGGDGLGATSASSVNPISDMMPIKAVSIQWLAKHYDEIEEEPGMIVIDEAHHALAKTYKEMWERFPNAKFLGLTATPCRLNGKGFTDLFDVLVQSWSVPEFISKGRLATYDFVSIKSDGVTQRLIDSLQKRGADGDYQNKEMDMLLNKKPSIERLYQSLEEFGKDRKGIVYAINISHANAIAEFYRGHGIAAVAIDSKTPSSLRKELIERFKYSSFSKTQPSILHKDFSNHPVPLSKEGSTFSPSPSSSGSGDVTAPPRRSEPLRSKDGGPSKVSPDFLSAGASKEVSKVSPDFLSAGASKDVSKVSPDFLSAGASKDVSMVSPDFLSAGASKEVSMVSPDFLSAGASKEVSKVSPDFLSAGASKDVSMVSPNFLSASASKEVSGYSPDCLCGVNRLADGLAPIQVLVNVDIFSEGFDCPDVEFVQLARPTLSLAKYLQMVGRGLRVAKGKKSCVIIDNVGLYRVFGLPSQVWNWNAMFEGKLKVGKKMETPKEREFFLMNKEQDGIRIHPDSEMMMVMSHEELLQTLQYREFVDSKGEFAIIKLPDGKMTVVNRHGEQVLEPGDYYDMKLLNGNILFFRPRRKAKCYYDLLAKAVIDDGTNVAEAPQVVNIKGWEFIEYNDIFMSRTQENFSLPYRPSQYDFLNYGYYMIFRFRPSAIGCQVWYYCEGDEGKMRMSNEESRNVCFLRNDYEHVYWLCAVLYGDCIVVMDSKQDYYLVDLNLKKTYIGCNNPKNEKEDLNVVMPRLGKKYYHEAMLQKKEMEANEMLLLHEKSEAGHVELYQAGKKWGVKVDGKVIVPPLYCSIAQPVGAYCAFEQVPRHWGVMTLKGKVIVDAKYEKVEIRDNGIAVVTGITGKTQTINLLKVKG